ncbi:WD repeat-containing protein 6 [Neophaeococcomyces mojaviensis]|uniref:WD repeat-containing protein 6 n=1 Tax=Neophaeococcomyces mojaviensis TaxID=3383035 RepID=A0ACC3A537_9EURO|nr:WD repeat-containing protein 6 [Knufia sp. JES_112]
MATLTDKWATSLLPVTALGHIENGDCSILLVGSGCLLEAIDVKTSTKLCSVKALTCQAIKNILTFGCNGQEKNSFRCDIFVQGGNQVVWIELFVEVSHGSTTNFQLLIVDSIRLRDWVLSGRSENYDRIATFLTSYNALYHITANTSSRKLVYRCLNDELSTFLYSGDVAVIDASSYIIASGTAFGEVLIWVCRFDERDQRWVAALWREYRGHRGSIFGVSLSADIQHDRRSRRIVASCSDDRTIHIWDASDADLEMKDLRASADTNASVEAKGLPMSTTNLAVTWAHASRIWSVDFVTSRVSVLDQPVLHLISTGEDATAQSWSLQLDDLFGDRSTSQRPLQNRCIDAHHTGKNIWSRCHVVHGDYAKLYTGGADGQIVARSYCTAGRADTSIRQTSQAFKDIFWSTPDNLPMGHSRQRSYALKSYLVLGSGQILATTDSGHLIKGFLHGRRISWQLLLTNSNTVPFVLSTQTVFGFVFLVNNSENYLVAYNNITTQAINLCSTRQAKVSLVETAWFGQHAASKYTSVCLAICYFSSIELDLVWTELNGNSCTMVSKSSVSLPNTFEVSSTHYDSHTRILLVGSRAGAVAVYTSVSSSTTNLAPACCMRHVHGSDTVTSFRRLGDEPESAGDNLFYLTTGRDGTYCVISVQLLSHHLNPPSARINIVHKATPPLGPNIEGSHLVHEPDGSKKLLLHGFRSTQFIVWNEMNLSQVMAVECGGAHRSWAFALDEQTSEGGTFVWTKAGTTMLHEQPRSDHQIIESGGHGREIKALGVHATSTSELLIATGSEDTDIRLFESAVNGSMGQKMKCIAVIRRHTTGLQDLKFSSDGKMLFSAAGMEEMYAWKLSPVPVLGQGVVFVGALPRHDTESDARIMSFDICRLIKDTEDSGYLIVAAFSNGKVKTISFAPSTGGTDADCFTVLNQLDLGTICLTQAHLMAMTNSSPNAAMVSGTNGFVNVYHVNHTNATDKFEAPNMPPAMHKIHQNSITAIQTISIAHLLQMLITGGDDSALAMTLYQPTADPPTRFNTLMIPKAHAAALTALATIELDSKDSNQKKYAIVTAGNDQRLKTWTVTIDVEAYLHDNPDKERGPMNAVQIDLLEDTYTNVADISGIAILPGWERDRARALTGDDGSGTGEGEDESISTIGVRVIKVLVVGVGMEVIRLVIGRS